jgi:hypothetical protein
MICVDATPTNIVKRPGFVNLMKTVDPRYKIPQPSTFSRSIIPKLKNTVDTHQMKKIKTVLDNETSIAFSTDGLDGNDVEKSAIYDFTVYFYERNKLCCETLYVKSLETPVTSLVVKAFLTECLKSTKILTDENKPRLSIWGITDEGSNVLCALKLMKEDGVIDGFHNCFNHKLQNAIKDASKATPGMESSLG